MDHLREEIEDDGVKQAWSRFSPTRGCWPPWRPSKPSRRWVASRTCGSWLGSPPSSRLQNEGAVIGDEEFDSSTICGVSRCFSNPALVADIDEWEEGRAR